MRWRARSSGAAGAIVVVAALAIAGCGDKEPQAGKVPPTPTPARDLPYAKAGPPAGVYAGDKPRGLVILIHGGGWEGENRDELAVLEGYAAHLRAQGYATLNVDYRPGAQGLNDIVGFYDRARAQLPRRIGICAMGNSAGAHLALMLAVRRRDLACAISLAGPTDLPALAREDGGKTAYDLAVAAFGKDELAAMSPVRQAARIRAAVMQVAASEDPFVPLPQVRALAAALPGSRLIVLPPGDTGFVHSRVARGPADAAVRAEDRFLARAFARR